MMHKTLGKSFITLETFTAQGIQQIFDQTLICATPCEFICQFLAAMFPPSQKVTCPLQDFLAFCTQTAAPSFSASSSWAPLTSVTSSGVSLGSNCSLIFASISSAIFGFSFKKLRTFSFPWPMRSSL